MAQLTDQLPTIKSGPAPIAIPGRAGATTFLGSLNTIAQGLLGAQADIRQSDAAYKRQKDEALAGEVIRNAQGILTPAPTTSPQVAETTAAPQLPVGISAELEGADTEARRATVAQMASLNRAKAAEDQGRLPVGSVNVKMDALLQQMLREHPGSEVTIMQTFKEFGYDSFIAKDIRLQAALSDARVQTEQSQQLQAENAAIQRFAQSGGDVTTVSRAEQLRLGREGLAADAQLQTAVAQSQAAAAAASRGDKDAESSLIKSGRDFYAATVANTQRDIGNLTTQLRTLSLSGSAVDQAQVQKALPQVRELFRTKILALRASTLSRAAEAKLRPDDINELNKYYDTLIADADKYIFSAPDERTTKALGRLQTDFKASAANAMPLYFALSSAFGQNTANSWLEGMQAGPNMDAIAKEVQAYDPAHPEKIGPTIQNIARLLRGELSIPDMDPVEAAKAIPSLEATAAGTRKRALLDGAIQGSEVGTYANSVGGLLNAASALPRDARASSYWRASDSLLSPEALKAAKMVIKEDEQTGRELVFGSRQFAFQTIQTIGNRPSQSYWDFKYQDGKYVPVLNEQRWKEEQALTTLGPRGDSSFIGSQRAQAGLTTALPRPTWSAETDPDVRAQFDVLNRSLNFLVETDQYDEAVPTDVTPRARRDAYARGLPVTSLAAQSAAPAKAIAAVDAISANLSSDIVQIQNNPETAWAENDPRWLTSTVFGENFNGSDAEMQAIAATIINRAKLSGQSLRDVVTAGNGSQYNVWKPGYAGRDRMLRPSPEEQARLDRLLSPLLQGELPAQLQGVTHFYHPSGMTSSRTPDFAKGAEPVKVGAGLFYRRPGDFQRGQ